MTTPLTALTTLPHAAAVLAQDDAQLFLGDDFLPWMVLALGAAMVVGNILALVRPPADRGGDTPPDPEAKPPVVRAAVMIVIGAVAAIWGVASLLA
ncbi:MAG: hypothetical protein ACYC2O_11660 [Microthrixaceae bacterium]